MLDLCKKLAMAGVGLEGKLKTTIDDLAKAGEENDSLLAEKVKGMLKTIDESCEDGSLTECMGKLRTKLDLPSKGEIDKLAEQLKEIQEKLAEKDENNRA